MGYQLNKSIMISELVNHFSLSFIGADLSISAVSSELTVESNQLTFTNKIPRDVTGAVFITNKLPDIENLSCNTFIIVDSPRQIFATLLDYLNSKIGFNIWKNPPLIDPTASIGQNVVIENGCVVGANSIIEHNVVLHSGTRIGRGSRIRSLSSIGGDGFGFVTLDNGALVRFPHLGGVVIGNDVEIGSLNSISRGTLSDTIISDNVKTDNLVHIAHNCLVGTNTLITACAELSGSVTLGDNVWVGPNSSVMQKVSVGDDALIGLGAVVTKDVQEKNVVAGNPARKIRMAI